MKESVKDEQAAPWPESPPLPAGHPEALERASWEFALMIAFNAWDLQRRSDEPFLSSRLPTMFHVMDQSEHGWSRPVGARVREHLADLPADTSAALALIGERFQAAHHLTRRAVIRRIINVSSQGRTKLASLNTSPAELLDSGLSEQEVAGYLRRMADILDGVGRVGFYDTSSPEERHVLAFVDVALLQGAHDDLYRAADDKYPSLMSADEQGRHKRKIETMIRRARDLAGVRARGRRGRARSSAGL